MTKFRPAFVLVVAIALTLVGCGRGETVVRPFVKRAGEATPSEKTSPEKTSPEKTDVQKTDAAKTGADKTSSPKKSGGKTNAP